MAFRALSRLPPSKSLVSQSQLTRLTPSCLESPVGATRAYPGGRLKAVKRRRKTVNTIGKITNTMKVVASSKLPSVQAKAAATTPFFTSFLKGLSGIADVKPGPDDKILTLVICTDKGLCGSTNNGLTRLLLKENLSNQKIVVWGDKGCGAFERSIYRDNVLFSAHPNQKTTLSFTEVTAVVELFLKEDFDVLRIVYNRMASAAAPSVDFLYIPTLKKMNSDDVKDKLVQFEIEATNQEELIRNLTEYVASAAVNYACFQNQNVELFARRNSMDNASKNAKEVGKKLTIRFNRERQAMITTELGEITSGAAAVAEGG